VCGGYHRNLSLSLLSQETFHEPRLLQRSVAPRLSAAHQTGCAGRLMARSARIAGLFRWHCLASIIHRTSHLGQPNLVNMEPEQAIRRTGEIDKYGRAHLHRRIPRLLPLFVSRDRKVTA
jgi:hypothetical protein